MPDEYVPYVYLFRDESTEGIYETLKILLHKSTSELHAFGCADKNFILSNKSNIEQARKLTDFIGNVLK